MEKYAIGLKNFTDIAGNNAISSIEELKTISPELATMVIEFAYGDIHSLERLSKREKEMICISSLISQGEINSALLLHYKAALTIGISVSEIKEVIIHCVAYVGFPKAIKAMLLLKKAIDEEEM